MVEFNFWDTYLQLDTSESIIYEIALTNGTDWSFIDLIALNNGNILLGLNYNGQDYEVDTGKRISDSYTR